MSSKTIYTGTANRNNELVIDEELRVPACDSNKPSKRKPDIQHLLGQDRFALVGAAMASRADLSGPELRTLIALSARAHSSDSRCYPSNELLMEDCAIERRPLQHHIEKLEKKGLILTYQCQGPGGTNVYEIQPDPPALLQALGGPSELHKIMFRLLTTMRSGHPNNQIVFRRRKLTERNIAIDDRNEVRSQFLPSAFYGGPHKLLTPGIVLYFQGGEARSPCSCPIDCAENLETMLLAVSKKWLPWSLFLYMLHGLNSMSDQEVQAFRRGDI